MSLLIETAHFVSSLQENKTKQNNKTHLCKICRIISEPHSGINDFFTQMFGNRGGQAEHPLCFAQLSGTKLQRHREARPPCLHHSFWHRQQKKPGSIPCSAFPNTKSHAQVSDKYLHWKILFWGEVQQCYISLIYELSTVFTSVEGFKAPRH